MAQRILTETIATRIGKTMRRELRREAKRLDRSEGAIVRQALREYLNRRNGYDNATS